MNDSILVTVIVPFMNEETFLEETINSVIQQDYKNWELLLIDDGSTNKSTEIAKKHAALYSEKIYYFDHEGHQNKGVCASRNLGVAKAKGKLICFIDADDVWLPQKLYHQVKVFNQFPTIGMAIEASEYWFDWNDKTKVNVKVQVGSTQDSLHNPPELLYNLYPLSSGAAPVPCSWMLTKEAILKVGGFEESFVKQYQLFEDQAFLCKIYLNEKVFISSACNNKYRQRPESVVKWVNASGQYHKVRKYFLDWFVDYIRKNNIRNDKLNKLIEKSLFPYNSPALYFIFNTLPAKLITLIKKVTPLRLKRFFLSNINK